MDNNIKINNLTKVYDTFKLDSIDLDIPKGEIIGLIGENGAGKTTLIKSILGIIIPDEGNIEVFGKDIYSNDVNKDIGAVLDNMFFPEILTPRDINSIMKDMYDTWDENQFMRYMKTFDLPMEKPLKKLSKGMRKKVEIATSLSHHPKLLILDEPTTGLDPIVRNEVLDMFLEFIQDEKHSILLSTHITSDLEHIADRIVFIDEGKIVLNSPRDDIEENYGVLKCDIDKFEQVDKDDVIAYKKNRYNYDILIKNMEKMKKKYKNYVIDKINLEDLMLLMIKGER